MTIDKAAKEWYIARAAFLKYTSDPSYKFDAKSSVDPEIEKLLMQCGKTEADLRDAVIVVYGKDFQ